MLAKLGLAHAPQLLGARDGHVGGSLFPARGGDHVNADATSGRILQGARGQDLVVGVGEDAQQGLHAEFGGQGVDALRFGLDEEPVEPNQGPDGYRQKHRRDHQDSTHPTLFELEPSAQSRGIGRAVSSGLSSRHI